MSNRILRAQPRVPSYRRHKATGRGVVTLNGRDHYLPGRYGSAESKLAFDRLIADWLGAGRQQIAPMQPRGAGAVLVLQLAAGFWRYAELHYAESAGHLFVVRSALRALAHLYADTPAIDFGPKKLKALREFMVESGHTLAPDRGKGNGRAKSAQWHARKPWSRGYVNKCIDIVRLAFRWAVENELIDSQTDREEYAKLVSTCQAISEVRALRRGKTGAREAATVVPVDDVTVERTLPYLPNVVGDLVRFQRLTGCRPGEACSIRPADVDMSNAVWAYTPRRHKTECHGRERRVFIGPRAQEILRPYLLRPAGSFCFSPAESERKRKREMRARRRTKVQPSQFDRTKPKAQQKPGEYYNKDAFNRAVKRAVAKANDVERAAASRECREPGPIEDWTPNQLRHSLATQARRSFGLEASQVVLGHARADTTQIYAERDYALAERVAQQIG